MVVDIWNIDGPKVNIVEADLARTVDLLQEERRCNGPESNVI